MPVSFDKRSSDFVFFSYLLTTVFCGRYVEIAGWRRSRLFLMCFFFIYVVKSQLYISTISS